MQAKNTNNNSSSSARSHDGYHYIHSVQNFSVLGLRGSGLRRFEGWDPKTLTEVARNPKTLNPYTLISKSALNPKLTYLLNSP